MPATTQAIRIAPRRSAHRQSKLRKQFNALVQKRETERVKLAHWRNEVPTIRAMADGELMPLAQALSDCMRQILFQHHRDWSTKALSRLDRETLSECICELAQDQLLKHADIRQLKAWLKHVCTNAPGFDFNDPW
jgi:hypothetical protein